MSLLGQPYNAISTQPLAKEMHRTHNSDHYAHSPYMVYGTDSTPPAGHSWLDELLEMHVACGRDCLVK